MSVEEAKSQRDPPSVSSLFLKFHLQLSVKFRNCSRCLEQLRVCGSRLAPWALWNSRFTARAGKDCWTDTCTAQLLTASTPSHCSQALEILQHVHKYGNYTRGEGIPISSRLKNNSQLMKHKGEFTSRAGLERESTEAREAVPVFAKMQEKVRKL